MANQLTLAFSVATASTIYTPAQAAAKLAAVPLYASAGADPVLGQAFGLTVASDVVSTGGVTYSGEAGGPFQPGETVTGGTSHATATIAVDEGNGVLFFVAGSESGGPFSVGETVTGGTSGATATVVLPAAGGGSTSATPGPTSTTPGATRVLTLNMTAALSAPYAPPPFPCRPTGPLEPPPGAPPTLPYVLTQTTTNQNTHRPVTAPAPAAVVAFYSTSDLDTDGVDTVPAIPAGAGAQVMALSYLDTAGAPFTVYTKLTGKFPAVVTLGSALPVAEITACFIEQTGAFESSVGQITLAALAAPLPTFPANATPDDFPGLTDAAQLTITRPLVYLPPSYFALAQQSNSDPQLAGDFLVAEDSPTVLTSVSQIGILVGDNAALTGTVDVTNGDEIIVFSVPHTLPTGTVLLFEEQPGTPYVLAEAIVSAVDGTLTAPYTGTSAAATDVSTSGSILEFASQPGVQYTVASVYATGLKLTTPYTGLSPAEIAPAAEAPHPAQSVSAEADRVVTSATLVAPSQAAPPDSAHLTTLLSEFTLPQETARALTYVDESGPFSPGETVVGQKSGGTGVVLYDDPGVNATGLLAFTQGSVKNGFVKGETVTGKTSGATATVVVPRTLASDPLPTKLSGLYARTLSLVLGAPVVSQPITLI